MNTAWKSVALAIAVSLLVAAAALFLIFRFLLPAQEPSKEEEAQFVIGVWEEQVAVFEQGREYPVQVFDTRISTLPPEQQQQVRAGIPARDADRLSVLLEDYTS